MTQRLPRILASIFVTLTAGCEMGLRPTPVPIRTIAYARSPSPPEQSTLLILLPGRQSSVEDFEKKGIIDTIPPERNFDVIAVDGHMGYYRNKTIHTRLLEDVIRPARKKGYRRIEIAGISLGGLGSLFFTLNHPEAVDRITLIAPFVGDESIANEIREAGGLRKWNPGPIGEEDFQRELWGGLKAMYLGESSTRTAEMRIGFGESDRLQAMNVFFSDTLLSGKRVSVPGGHNWPTWKKLFENFF